MKAIPADWSDMFPGGVPGWLIFGAQVQDIRTLLTASLPIDLDLALDRTLAEIAFIGLVAHFEGLVRYHFASLINVCPRLLIGYSERMPTSTVSLQDIALLETLNGSIGYLVADAVKFTSPKDINQQYFALMKITPFGKADAVHYDAILKDRHQLVHSAGIFTTKYIKAHMSPMKAGRDRAYIDSVEISKDSVLKLADFLQNITEKLIKSTHAELCKVENWNSASEFADRSEHLAYFQWSDIAFEKDDDPSE